VGAEWVHENVGTYGRWTMVGRTASDVRDTMVEGESGVLATQRKDNPCHYMPTKRKVVWQNGAMALLFSADEPDQLRGPQAEASWLDELAAWKHPEAYDYHIMGLRLGLKPRQVITTTPRPTRIIRDLMKEDSTVVTRGSTYENRDNLPDAFFDLITKRYEGTRMGRQELYAEVLDDLPGALWTRDRFRYGEPRKIDGSYDLIRVVVAIDPAISSNEDSDETGIVVVGLGGDGLVYVLDDLSMRGSPDAWARRAVYAYSEWMADRIVAESNQGGDMVSAVIRNVAPEVPVRLVTATRGKRVRAEPISALYEQGRVYHLSVFADLEDQMVNFVPDHYEGSPDRMDALVWGVTELKPDRVQLDHSTFAATA
jgi:phage terminase large subunit-like protein